MGLQARATVETLTLMAVTFLLEILVFLVAGPALVAALFVLTSPLPLLSPWTLVTSVYAHAGLGHLLGNAVLLVPAGIAVERTTSRWRFHGFFVAVGAASGLAQVLFFSLPFVGGVASLTMFGSLAGAAGAASTPGVVGASGAILGLVGYAIAGNAVADTVVAGFELDARAQLAAIAVVAAGLALWMAGPGIANVGHFAGLGLGLLAGRTRLLHVDGS